jgi:hypothetical protein
MEIDESASAATTTTTNKSEAKKESEAILPESDVYLRLLVIVGLIDVKEVEKVSLLSLEARLIARRMTLIVRVDDDRRHSNWPKTRQSTFNP